MRTPKCDQERSGTGLGIGPRRWVGALFVVSCILVAVSVQAQNLQSFAVSIAERQVAAGGPVIRVTQGDTVEITWSSDEAGELHIHGYDLKIALDPAAETVTRFEAFAAGRFPITSHGFAGEDGHGDHSALLYLEVYPD